MSDLRILVTGSRDWWDWHVIEALLRQTYLEHSEGRRPDEVVVVHGGARGADALAARSASRMGFQVEEHPADWERYGKAAGHRRNAEMVAAGADICLAFPLGESRGTRGCMRLAEKAGIPVENHGEWEDV